MEVHGTVRQIKGKGRLNTKWNVLNKIMEAGLVLVVRADDLEQAKRIAEACKRAAAIEIPYTVPGATKVIEELAAAYKPEA